MNDTTDAAADRVIEAMEEAVDRLEPLRTTAARAESAAKEAHARALLAARGQGHRAREEREAYATLASIGQAETAAICERAYRDTLTYIRLLQSRLDLIRTQMVSHRDLRV